MPVYGYKCKTCGHEFDEVRSIEARHSPAQCQMCKAWAERVMTTPGVVRVSQGTYHTITVRNPTGRVT
jgi:putative FmdB family regulatory protein